MSTESNEALEAQHTDEELLRKRRKHTNTDLVTGLNLTAMMDVLTILLVYLIKVYADAPENITLNDDLRPPASTAPANIQPSVTILISKTAILVDNKPVLVVENGGIQGGTWLPLAKALDKRVETIKAIQARGGSPFDGNLMVIADEETKYDIISNTLFQAGNAEFVNYQLVVRRK